MKRWTWLCVLAVVACGGTAVVDDPIGSTGAGGDGGGFSSTSSSIPLGCDAHADCADVCIFETGQCSVGCNADAECALGEHCDLCATSSCPGCEDCRAACVPE